MAAFHRDKHKHIPEWVLVRLRVRLVVEVGFDVLVPVRVKELVPAEDGKMGVLGGYIGYLGARGHKAAREE